MARRRPSAERDRRRDGRKGEKTLFYCPHNEDKVHHDCKSCPFRGSKEELREHLEICAYEAAEVRHLAESMASYLRRHLDQAVELVAIVTDCVQRWNTKDVDERLVKICDAGVREVAVTGLDLQPMRRPFAQDAAISAQLVDDSWSEFLSCCLPGFRPVCIPYQRQRGSHVIEDLLESSFRDVEGEAQHGIYVPDQHSYRVWMLAIQAAEATATRALEMGMLQTPSSAAASLFAQRNLDPITPGRAKLRQSVGVAGGGGGDLMKVLKVFKQWDLDGNGSISREEMLALMSSLDSTLSSMDVDSLFAAADMNKDMSIDYAEFVAWILK